MPSADKKERIGPISRSVDSLPDQVFEWLGEVLESGEYVAGCFYADILPDGAFGERWNLLTNRRYLVLAPDTTGAHAEIVTEIPFEEIHGAETRSYVGSGAVILKCGDDAREVARYRLGSRHEAADLCYYLNEAVKGRGKGKA